MTTEQSQALQGVQGKVIKDIKVGEMTSWCDSGEVQIRCSDGTIIRISTIADAEDNRAFLALSVTVR